MLNTTSIEWIQLSLCPNFCANSSIGISPFIYFLIYLLMFLVLVNVKLRNSFSICVLISQKQSLPMDAVIHMLTQIFLPKGLPPPVIEMEGIYYSGYLFIWFPNLISEPGWRASWLIYKNPEFGLLHHYLWETIYIEIEAKAASGCDLRSSEMWEKMVIFYSMER